MRASDLLQDAYLEVVRRAGSFRGETIAEFASWVGQIITSCAREQHRYLGAAKRHAPSTPSELRSLFELRPARASPPSAHLRDSEDLARYGRAMERLSEDHRAVIQAMVLDARPVDEVAREMDRSPAAVHALLARARAALAVQLERAGDGRADRGR